MDVVVIRCQARRKMNPRWPTLNDGWSVGDIMRYDPVESAKLTQIFRFVCVVLSKWILDSIQCRTGRAVKRNGILRCAKCVSELWLKHATWYTEVLYLSHVFDGVTDRCIFTGVNLWGTWATTTIDKQVSEIFLWERKGAIFSCPKSPETPARVPSKFWPIPKRVEWSRLLTFDLNYLVGFAIVFWEFSCLTNLIFGL